jgi:hypothetical protein
MTFGYVQPFSFQIGTPSAIKVAGVRHGVTEITLSDGRLVRASLHIKDVKPSAERPGSLDISYNVITEVMVKPSVPICKCTKRFSKTMLGFATPLASPACCGGCGARPPLKPVSCRSRKNCPSPRD